MHTPSRSSNDIYPKDHFLLGLSCTATLFLIATHAQQEESYLSLGAHSILQPKMMQCPCTQFLPQVLAHKEG
uniref:Uncharacterized protein n=1 Tax=Arundo donax TaxID=35708 RepID=A0A0A9DQY9_ARUDO